MDCVSLIHVYFPKALDWKLYRFINDGLILTRSIFMVEGVFQFRECGNIIDRDVNAAYNLCV